MPSLTKLCTLLCNLSGLMVHTKCGSMSATPIAVLPSGSYLRTWVLNKEFLAISVLIRSLFLVNSPCISEKCCQACYFFFRKLGLIALGLLTNFSLDPILS